MYVAVRYARATARYIVGATRRLRCVAGVQVVFKLITAYNRFYVMLTSRRRRCSRPVCAAIKRLLSPLL